MTSQGEFVVDSRHRCDVTANRDQKHLAADDKVMSISHNTTTRTQNQSEFVWLTLRKSHFSLPVWAMTGRLLPR